MKAGVDEMDAAVQDAVSQQKYPLLNQHISSDLQKYVTLSFNPEIQ